MRKRLKCNELLASIPLALTIGFFGCSANTIDRDQASEIPPMMSSSSTATTPSGSLPLIDSGPGGMTSAAIENQSRISARNTLGGLYLGPADPDPSQYAGQVAAGTAPSGLYAGNGTYATNEVNPSFGATGVAVADE